MSNILLVCACFACLVLYGYSNWQAFRRWLVICLPSGLLTSLLVGFLSGNFWGNLPGCVFIALLASAFLTWVDKQKTSAQ